MSDQTPRKFTENFLRACVLLLGGIAAIYFALALLAKIWVWLLLAAVVALAVAVAVWAYRYWWSGR